MTSSPAAASPPRLSAFQVLACGAAIVTLSMGVRHGFGLWLQPITQDQGWTRENFAFALAIQNLSWGLFGIFAGMAADRFGAFRVLAGGAVLYGLGLAGMALTTTPLGFALTTGVLIGAAQAGTTYAVIYGVIGRQIPAEKRSWAMGVAAAAGSFGQFLMVPVEGALIAQLGWQNALLVLGVAVLLIAPLAWGLREPGFAGGQPPQREQTIGQALREAFGYRSFQLLMAGYFVCGFQVVFIGVHMPSYLKDHGLSPQVASYALALIGLFNVLGTYVAGTVPTVTLTGGGGTGAVVTVGTLNTANTAGRLIKSGFGTLTLTGVNTFETALTLNSGVVAVGSGGTLNATTLDTTKVGRFLVVAQGGAIVANSADSLGKIDRFTSAAGAGVAAPRCRARPPSCRACTRSTTGANFDRSSGV